MTTEVHARVCRICAPSCGVLVTVDGDAVTGVRGDPDDPVSRGYTCPKGRALGHLHHDPRRLGRPEMRVDGDLVAVSWETCLDDLAERIAGVIERAGPDALAWYQGTPALQEGTALPIGAALMDQLGSHSRYSSLTVDISAKMTVAALMLGATLFPIVDVEQTTLALVLGTNPVVSHGQYNGFSDPVTRLREISQRGEVWVVDPRRTETAHHATRHLSIRPGTDHALLAHLVRSVLRRGIDRDALVPVDGLDELAAAVEPWDLERTTRVTGLASGEVEELVDAIARAGRLAVLTGTGLTMARTGNVSEWLALALLVVTDSFDRAGGTWFNPTYLRRQDRLGVAPAPVDDGSPGPRSRPDVPRFRAEHPCAALPDEIEAGTVKALLSFGGNPLIAVAEPDRLRRAISGLDAFAVIGTVRDAQAEVATHVLPSTGMLERSNVVSKASQLRVSAQYAPAVLAPVAERRPSWWIFAQLAARLGLDVMPAGVDMTVATDDDVITAQVGAEALAELRRHPSGVLAEDPPDPGWVAAKLPYGHVRLAPSPLLEQLAGFGDMPATDDPPSHLALIPRRLLRRFNSVHSPVGRQDDQQIVIAPSDADPRGITDGDRVIVRSADGEVDGIAVVDDGIRPGAVAASHGFDDVNIAGLTSTSGVDPLTGMVVQTGVAVTVERASNVPRVPSAPPGGQSALG